MVNREATNSKIHRLTPFLTPFFCGRSCLLKEDVWNEKEMGCGVGGGCLRGRFRG